AHGLDPALVQILAHPLDPVRLPLGDDDRGAVLAQVVGHAPADSLAGTGDEHDFSVDSPHVGSLTQVSGLPLISDCRYILNELCRRAPKRNARRTLGPASSPPPPTSSPARAFTRCRPKPWRTRRTAPPARSTATSAARTVCCSRSSSSG